MKQKSNVLLPKILGYLGLLPFVIPTFFLFYDYHHLEMWRHFLITYAAVILSFVGALHWSFAMLLHDLSLNKQRWSFVWSVIPSIMAWVALFAPHFRGSHALLDQISFNSHLYFYNLLTFSS
jgi:hypothetical protein